MQQSGTTGGAEGLKGDRGDDEPDGIDSGGGRARLGRTIYNKGDWLLNDKDDLELGLTRDDLDLNSSRDDLQLDRTI